MYAKDSNRDHFDRLNVVNSQTMTYGEKLLLPAYWKSFNGFRMVYFHLTLAHSKGEGYGNAQFDCQYLVNGEDATNIASAKTGEVACRLSLYMFSFDLNPF